MEQNDSYEKNTLDGSVDNLIVKQSHLEVVGPSKVEYYPFKGSSIKKVHNFKQIMDTTSKYIKLIVVMSLMNCINQLNKFESETM